MQFDQLKSQLLTIFTVKGGENMDGIYPLIYSMIMIYLLETFIKLFPMILEMGKIYSEKMLRKHVKSTIIDPEITSRIIFEQFYTNKKEDSLTDAILDYICKLDNACDLFYNYFYLVNKKEIFDINKNIKIKIVDKKFGEDGILKSIKFEIFSYTLSLSKLKSWVNEINREFMLEKKNQFGEKRFFFDEIAYKNIYGANTIPSNLTFTMTEFQTNKNLKNIYGKHVDIVKKRIDLFKNNSVWYEERGIPLTLGILLSGKPGTGKTSLIKAIAKDTDRHIFNIKLNDKSTPEQLNDLFYNEVVKIKNTNNNGMDNTIIVPLNKRIYVIEDIDCLSEIILDREFKEKMNEYNGNLVTDTDPVPLEFQHFQDTIKPKSDGKGSNYTKNTDSKYCGNGNLVTDTDPVQLELQHFQDMFANTIKKSDGRGSNYTKNTDSKYCGNNRYENQKMETSDPREPPKVAPTLTLSFLLNLFDGVLETPGRILIITSNYPERIDKALIRPGRIDINLYLDYCTPELISDIYRGFYKIDKDFSVVKKVDYTPAKIQEILCNNFDDPENAYNCIIAE